MERLIIDKHTGWEYELQGDYYFPTGRVMRNGVLTPESVDNGPGEEMPIGIWGRGCPVDISDEGRSADRAGRRDQRHLNYIRQHNKPLYLELALSGELNTYLADVDARAEDLFLRAVKEMAARDGVTEKLKAEDQMAWVQRMNNLRERATEIVNQELIFT